MHSDVVARLSAACDGSAWRRRSLLFVLALLTLALAPASAEAASRVSADFNGDGADDLAVGVPNEDVGAVADAGAVNVIYGATGLTATDDQVWHQDVGGIFEAAEQADRFGSSLTAGDFDGDGADDLAVGVPNESVGSVAQAGAVNVIYGSAIGLTATGNQVWHQDIAGIFETPEAFDLFGFSLSAGDVDGDGVDDLAVGVPGEDVGTVANAGAVNVIYGAAGTGLTATGDQVWHQDIAGIVDPAEGGDFFGASLSAGDFDGDGVADLAVGVPFENVGSVSDAGAVNVIYGAAGTGLTATGDQVWHQDSSEIAGAAESSDRFGASLIAGDFDGDGTDDLAVGVPQEGVGTFGAVNVIYGSGAGLTSADNQLWHQDSPGIFETAEIDDRFGASLSAGDFDDDGVDDLAVGVPGETVGAVANAGAANVIYGTAAVGLTSTGDQIWHQDVAGIGETAEGGSLGGDNFGASLSAGDFDGGGAHDLAAGVPFESVGSVPEAGAVNVIYGAAGTGLTATGDQVWHQDVAGTADSAEASDRFGEGLPGSPAL